MTVSYDSLTPDHFGSIASEIAPAAIPAPSPEPVTATPQEPANDWLSNVKAAIADFRKACENTRVRRGRGVAASSIDVLSAAVVVCKAACARPAPGKYSKLMPAVVAMTEKLVERFEFFREVEPGREINVGPIIDAVDLLVQRLAVCGTKKRRESPRDLLQLQNLSTAQAAKMLGISAAAWESYKLDPTANPLPESPAEPEPAPITSLSQDLRRLLDRLTAVAGDADTAELDREIERQDQIIREANAKARQLEQRREALTAAGSIA